MVDRVGPLVTAVSATYVLAGQFIETVNTWTEYVALILAVAGVFVGTMRVMRRFARFVVKADRVVELLGKLESRLEHGDSRMTRIEKRMGLEPMPFPDDRDDADGA